MPDLDPTIDRWQLALPQQQWRGLRLRSPAGELAVDGLTLFDLEATLARDGPGWRLQRLAAREVALEGLRLDAELPGRPPGSTAPWLEDLMAGWQDEALRGLHGMLQTFVTDAAWFLDATISMPVRSGRIEFDRVRVEHLGPDSAMGVSGGGLYVDAPRLARRYMMVFTGALPAGVAVEQREGRRIRSRGALDLAAIAGMLGIARPEVRWANAEAEAAMARSRLSGELQLGDGWLGSDALRLRLAGHALGANRLGVSAPALGGEITLRLPQLVAEEARLSLGGLSGGCGRMDATLALQLSGWWPVDGRPARPKLAAELPRAVLRHLELAAG